VTTRLRGGGRDGSVLFCTADPLATAYPRVREQGPHHMNEPSVPNTDTPAACPFCQSAAISTTSKAVSMSTYWRCATCGQIWNASRLMDVRPQSGLRSPGQGRW
jgi:hypothetical protein